MESMNAPLRDWLAEHPLPEPEFKPHSSKLPVMDDDDTDEDMDED